MRNSRSSVLAVLIPLTAILIAAFGNVAGNYFQCDDFLHTSYLYRVFHGEPYLLVRNFFDTWLADRSFFNFYRPLTELTLAGDYLLYRADATGYHLTNLVLHLLNALLVFPIALTLIEKFAPGKRRDNFLVSLLTSCIFISFPTHSEAVAWILSRSDLVATALYLLAYLCFLKEQKWLTGLFFILALLSKESAATLPFLLLATTYLQTEPGSNGYSRRLKTSFTALRPYFTILFIYLIVRALSIGTMVGGYVGSVGDTLSAHIIERWFTSGSLFYLFHPFNELLIPEDSPLRLSIRIIYCLFAILVAVNQFVDTSLARKTRLIILLLIWGLLTMAPNLQVFSISSVMAGGRISYLPAVSLSLLIAVSVYCFAPRAKSGNLVFVKPFAAITLLAFILVNCQTVKTNNLAWCASSLAVKKVKANIEAELDKLPADKKLAIINLPDQIAGAYTFTTRFDFLGMLSPPLSATGTTSRVVPLDFHNFWSANLNLDDLRFIAAHPEKYKLVAFDMADMRLKPFAVPTKPTQDRDAKAGQEPVITLLETASASARDAEETKTKIYYYSINPPVDPFAYQYLEFSYPGKLRKEDELTFFNWNNKPPLNGPDLPLNFSFENNKDNHFLFDVGERKTWLMSKNISALQVLMRVEKGRDYTPPTIRLLKEEQVAPTLSIVREPLGKINLTSTSCADYDDIRSMSEFNEGNLTVRYDATKIPRAKAVTLEISKPYFYFEHYTYLLRDNQAGKQLLNKQEMHNLTGTITLSRNEFPQAATYQLRLKAQDESGEIIGTYSTPLTLLVR